MQTLIEKYLDKNFTIKNFERKNSLFYKDTNELAYPTDFIDEITTVFSIKEKEVLIKPTIEWGVKTYGKRLKKYWSIIKPNLDWEGIAMPLVRRVFSSSISNDIVSVQPMNAPIGRLFYFDNSATTQTTEVQHVRIEPEISDGNLLTYQILTTR